MSGFINWGDESESQLELRRRFDEMVFEQARLRAMSNAQGGVGGGRLQNTIQSVQTSLVTYVNNETGRWEFFCASPIDGVFSEPFDTQIPDTFGRYDVYPLNLKGYLAVFMLDNHWDMYFVSEKGKVLSRLEIPNSTSLNINVDYGTNQILIVDGDSHLLWVWDGVTLYDHSDILQGIEYSIGTNGDSFIANGSLVVRTTTEPVDDIRTDTWYFIKDGVATVFDTLEWGPDDYRRTYAAFSGSNYMVSWAYTVATNVITHYGIVGEDGGFYASGPVDLVGTTNISWGWYGESNTIWMSGYDDDSTWMFNWDGVTFDTSIILPKSAGAYLSVNYDTIYTTSEYDHVPSNLLAALHGEWTSTNYLGGLQSVNDFTLIYKFPGQEAKSFTIVGESHFTQNTFTIGDSIFIGVLYQDNFRFLKITASTPSLAEVTTLADLESYFVPDLMFNVESYLTYLELTPTSTGIVFSSYAPSTTTSQITHYNGGNWEVDGNTLTFEDLDISLNTNAWYEAGAYLRVIDGDLIAWLPSINQWQTVLENIDENAINVNYTQPRFSAEHRDGSRFVVVGNDGTGLSDRIVTSSQIIAVSGIPASYSALRVGETGFYVIYSDADRNDLYSIKFWDFEGNLKWKYDTQYYDRSSRNFTDTRAIAELLDHATVAGREAIFIGNANGAKIKELTNTSNINYTINDAPWWD